MAEFAVDRLRIHGEALVRTAGEHLERCRPAACRLLRKLCRRGNDRIPILLHRHGRAYGMHAEHAGQRIARIINAVLRDAVHIDAPLVAAHPGMKASERVVDPVDELAFEEGAVQPLEMDLAIADEQYLFHNNPPLCFYLCCLRALHPLAFYLSAALLPSPETP